MTRLLKRTLAVRRVFDFELLVGVIYILCFRYNHILLHLAC